MNVSSGKSQTSTIEVKKEMTSVTRESETNLPPCPLGLDVFRKSELRAGAFILDAKAEFKKMLKKQTLNRWYNRNMKNLKERIKIIFGLMQKICKILELQVSTFCLSVNIFDAIISKYPVESSQMVPLGIIAVVLASKMNETNDKVITLADISRYIIPLDVTFLAKMERKAFSVLGFQLNMVLPENLICFLLHQFLSKEQEFFGAQADESKELTSRFLNIVNYLNLLTLVDYTFYKYTSVAVAVSILMYARKLCGLEEMWPEFLEKFTGISKEHVTECVGLINHRYKEQFVMKIFQKIDSEHGDGGIDKSQFLNPNLVEDSTYKNSEVFFMDNEVISKYMKSLKTMDSFRRSLKND
jgi:hypothetical protein